MASTLPDDGASYTLSGGSLPASPTPLKKNPLDLEQTNQPSEPTTHKDQSAQPPAKKNKKGLKNKIMFWRKDQAEEQTPEDEEQTATQKIPDPPKEVMGNFTILPSQLDEMFNPKSMENLDALGGVDGVVECLYTSSKHGLSHKPDPAGANFDQRSQAYGPNQLPERKSKSLLRLMWIAFQDKVLIILSIAAVISLALGIYQTVGTPPEVINGEKQPHVEWVEGVVSPHFMCCC